MQQNILFTIKRHALRLTHKVFPKRWLSQDGSKLVPVSAKVYNWQMLKTFHKLFFRVDFLVISFHRPSQLRVAATAQSALGTNLVLQELSLGIHSPECQVICKACKMDEFESRRIYHFLSAMNMCSFEELQYGGSTKPANQTNLTDCGGQSKPWFGFEVLSIDSLAHRGPPRTQSYSDTSLVYTLFKIRTGFGVCWNISK